MKPRFFRLIGAAVVIVTLSAACTGDSADDTTTTQEVPTSATTSTVAPATTVAEETTSSTVAEETEFTIAALGIDPDRALGSTPALGSGCSPGTDDLPDGAWFGWVIAAGPEQLDFDLACLWPGRLLPAASNDAARSRQVPVSPTAAVHLGDGEPLGYDRWALGSVAPPADNAPGLPPTVPYWLFVNDGVVTEIARYQEPIGWARSATAWPGLAPGCCDAGDVVPASPADPWPEEGWPVDGFYAPTIEARSETDYELSIQRWLSCRDNPGLCPAYWVGDEVTVDPDAPLIRRRLAFDETLTVVIMPIFDEAPLVGDGIALRELLADLDAAVASASVDDEFAWPEAPDERMADPAFPFGVTAWPNDGGDGPIGYRAPGGSHLTTPSAWWTALEIRDGNPVLYLHAGLVAG